MLELTNCKIGVGRTLYGIDAIAVEPGKLAVLIGANGSGKSTLLDAIALGQNDMGSISYNTRPLHEFSPEKRSLLISLVESRFAGAENLSTQEYLELGRFPHTGFSGRLDEEDLAIVSQFAQRLNLEHLLSQSTLTLSDGERQRAGIARALIQQTPLMLLDEPTSFLDYPNKRTMMKLLAEIALEENKIVLLASHDLELCLEYATDFLIVNPVTKKLEKYPRTLLTIERLVELAFETK